MASLCQMQLDFDRVMLKDLFSETEDEENGMMMKEVKPSYFVIHPV